MQPIYEFGGNGRVLHLAVANGFPPQTYAPLLQPLTEFYRVVSLPPRALWPGEKPPETLQDWHIVADDLLTGLNAHDLHDVIAVGHSFGGIASILAAVHEPERFRALVLLDPTILPEPAMNYMAEAQANGDIHQFPLVLGAMRRKQQWESIEEAYEYFRGKPLFSDWPDSAVWLYAQHGTRPTENGLELVWPAEWEAYYFSTLYTKTWDEVIKLKTPLLVIRGSESDTFRPEVAEGLRELLPNMSYAEVVGGHLFPQSAPDETRRVILDWLADVGI